MKALHRMRKANAVTIAAFLFLDSSASAMAEDAVDLILRHGPIPADMMNAHGYSDATEPLGRFLDFLAAGAFAEARAIQPEACATWLTTRRSSAFTGRFSVWNTEINLDGLCARQ